MGGGWIFLYVYIYPCEQDEPQADNVMNVGSPGISPEKEKEEPVISPEKEKEQDGQQEAEADQEITKVLIFYIIPFWND